jgi:spermidine synthase
VTVAGALPARAAEQRFEPAALRRLPDGDLATVESPYASIFVSKRGPLLTLSFRRQGLDLVQSALDLDRPDSLPAPYTRVLAAALLYAERPERLLALGMGGGTTDRYLQRRVPGLTVQAVELDPGVIDLAKRYFGVREAADYRIHGGDARVFLSRDRTFYDIVILDAFRGDAIPAHLATIEFDRLVRAHLRPGGVLALNLVAEEKLLASMLATLRAAFPTVELYRASGQWVAFAGAFPTPSPEALADRARALQARLHPPHDLRELVLLRRSLDPAPDAPILTDDYAPVDVWIDPRSLHEKE